MFKSNERGFSLIEIVVLLSLICVLGATSCIADYMHARDKAKEAEVKANCHTIQIALERYATDHSGAYPKYILGGDEQGWDPISGCKAIADAPDSESRPPYDPLIHFGYMYSYPANPFIDPGKGLEVTVAETGSQAELGYGDVRFGFTGEIMGNCLDDPRFLFDAEGQPTRLQYTMLPDAAKNIGVLRRSGSNSFYCQGGLKSGKAWWPGEFYYRSGGDFFVADPNNVTGAQYETIWGWPYMRINKYILGGYGSPRTEGMDVIRLTTKSGDTAGMVSSAVTGIINGEFYQDHEDLTRSASHPDFPVRAKYSNPEVFGGGENGQMPQFPYFQSGTRAWLFGAPDGFRDGVILVLTSGTDSSKFTEWPG